jgi:hypothetical protein
LPSRDDTKDVLADKFIKACGDLRDELGLRSHLPEIKKEDYPKMIANVFRDSMTWAVPKVMTYKEAEKMFDTISGGLDVAEKSSSKEEMKPLEIGIRAGIFSLAALLGWKKKNWVPFFWSRLSISRNILWIRLRRGNETQASCSRGKQKKSMSAQKGTCFLNC